MTKTKTKLQQQTRAHGPYHKIQTKPNTARVNARYDVLKSTLAVNRQEFVLIMPWPFQEHNNWCKWNLSDIFQGKVPRTHVFYKAICFFIGFCPLLFERHLLRKKDRFVYIIKGVTLSVNGTYFSKLLKNCLKISWTYFSRLSILSFMRLKKKSQ